MRVPLAREGWPFVLGAAGLALVALWWARHGGWGWRAAAPVALGAAALFVAWFFRDPARTPPPGPDLVVAPADGRVVCVDAVPDPAGGDADVVRVSIFLSIFNVHVQRAPLDGRVAAYDHRPGRFLPAWRPEASSENEQATLVIETDAGTVTVRQIAGLVARRIATYPRAGDVVERGERIGLIRFGSRVDLFVPASWEVRAAPGDVVRGGETVVARAESSSQ